MKRSTAAALLSLFLAPAPVSAADLAASPLSVPASSVPGAMVEVGTNWYIRGDIGVGFESLPTLSFPNIATLLPGSALVSSPSGSSSKFNSEWVAGIGVGYRYNDYLRFEATYDYREAPGLTVATGGFVCPTGATSSAGYVYDTTQTCNSKLNMKQHDNVLLANAYVDLGSYYGFTPYLGAGAGLNVVSFSGSATYTRAADGASYGFSTTSGTPATWVDKAGATINPQPGIPFISQSWDRNLNATKYHVAFALMAGVGYALGPNATLDLSYRYMNLGEENLTIANPSGAVIKTSSSAEDVRVGIRYLLN